MPCYYLFSEVGGLDAEHAEHVAAELENTADLRLHYDVAKESYIVVEVEK